MQFGSESALAPPQRVGLRRTLLPRRVLMGPDYHAIDKVQFPINLAGRLFLLLQGFQDTLPDPGYCKR